MFVNCVMLFSNDRTYRCMGLMFLDKDEVDSICESEKK